MKLKNKNERMNYQNSHWFSNLQYCIYLVAVVTLNSCGESKADREQREQKAQFSAEKAAINKVIDELNTAIDILDDKLKQYDYDLTDANREMDKVKEFQLLRSSDEKVEQIVAVQRKIDGIRTKINKSMAVKQKLKRKLSKKQQELDALVAEYGN